jgi:hypothetical protein
MTTDDVGALAEIAAAAARAGVRWGGPPPPPPGRHPEPEQFVYLASRQVASEDGGWRDVPMHPAVGAYFTAVEPSKIVTLLDAVTPVVQYAVRYPADYAERVPPANREAAARSAGVVAGPLTAFDLAEWRENIRRDPEGGFAIVSRTVWQGAWQ